MARAEAQSRGCLRLAASPGGHTYLGGKPELPANSEWPTWKGNPLGFLAQLDLNAAPKESWPKWMPTTGRLLFFYDAEQSTWGFDPSDLGSWRVIHVAGEEGLSAREAPSSLPSHAIRSRKPLKFVAGLSVPSWERIVGQGHTNLTSDEETKVEAFLDRAHARATALGPQHQLFGLPAPIQGDEMELECQLASNGLYVGDATGYQHPRRFELEEGATDWELLLQLDSDDDADMMWGDAGALYFWIRKQDAEKADFSKVWMVLQCG